MKSFRMILIVITICLIVMTLASCRENTEEPTTDIDINKPIVDPYIGAYIEVGSELKTLYLVKDVNGNVCTHVLLNILTNEYWIYDFEYLYDWNIEGYVFNRAYLTIKDINDKSVNITPNTNISTKDPIVNESNPCGTIWAHENFIKIIQGEITYDEFWNRWCISVTIENNSLNDITVSVRDLSINDIMCENFLNGMSVDINSGKKAITKFSIFIADLREMGIDILSYMDFTIVAYDQENIFDYLLEEEVYVNLNGLKK